MFAGLLLNDFPLSNIDMLCLSVVIGLSVWLTVVSLQVIMARQS